MPGWVNIHCVFCMGPKDFHLGFHEKKEYFNCWRCGSHPLEQTLVTLLGLPFYEIKGILTQYRTGRPVLIEQSKEILHPSTIKMPGKELEDPHIRYLNKRGFNNKAIEKLEKTYKIRGTGPVGLYNFRVMVPIYFDGTMVSYQGRDYTERSLTKYMACAKKDEIREHKHCLFGMDEAISDTVVLVEGIFDVLKLGEGAVATFGTSLTLQQIKLIIERWKHKIILFDRDASTKARELADKLSFLGTTKLVFLDDYKDPGEMSIEKARELKNKLLKN